MLLKLITKVTNDQIQQFFSGLLLNFLLLVWSSIAWNSSISLLSWFSSLLASYCCSHKLPQTSGLKQHIFMILQIWRSKLNSVSAGENHDSGKEPSPLGGSEGRQTPLQCCPAPRGCLRSWAQGASLPPFLWSLPSVVSSPNTDSALMPPLKRLLCLHIGLTWITQGSLSISRF